MVHISTIKLLIGIHFKVVTICRKHYNVRQGLRNINFNDNSSMKLCTYKETTIMNNFPHQKFPFVIKSSSLH
jgi:hypothetical protein